MGEVFSGEGQPSICAMGIAGLSQWVVRNSSETGSLLVSSNYSRGPLTLYPTVAPAISSSSLHGQTSLRKSALTDSSLCLIQSLPLHRG